jgi:hypothetical protein
LAHRLKQWAQASGHKRTLLLAVPILLLATVLRVSWPTLTEFKFSEARLEALALEVTREGHLPLVGVPSSAGFDHSPISVYLYLPPFLLTTDPIPATIYGGLIGVAAVALCWWLARRWPGGGWQAAWIAALLFAVSPWSVAFSRKIWQVVFVPFLALVLIGLVISALIEEPTPGAGRGRRWHLAWALVTYALLVQVHPSAVSLAPALALWLVLFWKRVGLGPLLVGTALAALSSVPFVVHQVQSGWPVLAALKALPEATWDLSAVQLAWEAITGLGIHALAGNAYPLLRIVPQLSWILGLTGWLVVVSALWLAWRTMQRWRATDSRQQQQARVDLVLLTWLAVPVLFNLRHSLDLYLHFFALVLPAAYLIVGRAVQDLLNSRQASRLYVPGAVGLGFLAVVQVAVLVLMGQFVATHDTSGGFGAPLGRYLAVADRAVARATEQGATEIVVVGQGDSVIVDETPAIFDVLLRDRAAYRFVDGGVAALFPAHSALALLTPGAGEAAEWYHSLPATGSDLPEGYLLAGLNGTPPLRQLQPVTGLRLFQNGIEVEGYAWAQDAVPQGQARLWLLWQVLWLSADDTHFFAHLVDETGQQWGQQDIDGYPTVYRRKGDWVVNAFDIRIEQGAPSGPYRARVGLYLYPQVENVPVIDQAGNPAAGEILLGP